MHAAKDYVAIEFWHKRTGAYPNYIRNVQQQASVEGAPINATYYSTISKKWRTMDDLAPDHPFRELYDEYLLKRHGTKV